MTTTHDYVCKNPVLLECLKGMLEKEEDVKIVGKDRRKFTIICENPEGKLMQAKMTLKDMVSKEVSLDGDKIIVECEDEDDACSVASLVRYCLINCIESYAIVKTKYTLKYESGLAGHEEEIMKMINSIPIKAKTERTSEDDDFDAELSIDGKGGGTVLKLPLWVEVGGMHEEDYYLKDIIKNVKNKINVKLKIIEENSTSIINESNTSTEEIIKRAELVPLKCARDGSYKAYLNLNVPSSDKGIYITSSLIQFDPPQGLEVATNKQDRLAIMEAGQKEMDIEMQVEKKSGMDHSRFQCTSAVTFWKEKDDKYAVKFDVIGQHTRDECVVYVHNYVEDALGA